MISVIDYLQENIFRKNIFTLFVIVVIIEVFFLLIAQRATYKSYYEHAQGVARYCSLLLRDGSWVDVKNILAEESLLESVVSINNEIKVADDAFNVFSYKKEKTIFEKYFIPEINFSFVLPSDKVSSVKQLFVFEFEIFNFKIFNFFILVISFNIFLFFLIWFFFIKLKQMYLLIISDINYLKDVTKRENLELFTDCFVDERKIKFQESFDLVVHFIEQSRQISLQQEKILNLSYLQRLKDRLLLLVHDLKSPLMAISLMEQDKEASLSLASSDVVIFNKKLLDLIIKRLNLLTEDAKNIVNDFALGRESNLNISKTSSKMSIPDFKRIVCSSIHYYKSLHPEVKFTLKESDVDRFYDKVYLCNESLFECFVGNIISNSIQQLYLSPQARESSQSTNIYIQIELSSEDHFFKIAIKDNGQGFSQKQLDQLNNFNKNEKDSKSLDDVDVLKLSTSSQMSKNGAALKLLIIESEKMGCFIRFFNHFQNQDKVIGAGVEFRAKEAN